MRSLQEKRTWSSPLSSAREAVRIPSHCRAVAHPSQVLERVHGAYFRARNRSPAGESLDVRDFLREQQRRVLHGCKILFSRVFPVSLRPLPPEHALGLLGTGHASLRAVAHAC